MSSLTGLGGAILWRWPEGGVRRRHAPDDRGRHAKATPISLGFISRSRSPATLCPKPSSAPSAKALARTGYVEGRNVAIEYRWAEGHYGQLPALADAISPVSKSGGDGGAEVAPRWRWPPRKRRRPRSRSCSRWAAIPSRCGVVDSLSRPGGNLTGDVEPQRGGLAQARSEFMREVRPGTKTIRRRHQSVESRPRPRSSRTSRPPGTASKASLSSSCRASTEEEFDSHVRRRARGRRGRPRLQLGSVLRLSRPAPRRACSPPSRAGDDPVARLPDGRRPDELWRRLPSIASPGRSYAGRVLKGEKPSDLPVQRVTKIELFLNLKAAHAHLRHRPCRRRFSAAPTKDRSNERPPAERPPPNRHVAVLEILPHRCSRQSSAPLLIAGGSEAWFGYRDQRARLSDLLDAEARLASAKITGLRRGHPRPACSWTSATAMVGRRPATDARVEALRLLRRVPAVEGLEPGRWPGHGTAVRHAHQPRTRIDSRRRPFRQAGCAGSPLGSRVVRPGHLHRRLEPFITVAIAGNRASTAWPSPRSISSSSGGDLGHPRRADRRGDLRAFDRPGRLVAHPDIKPGAAGGPGPRKDPCRRCERAVLARPVEAAAGQDICGKHRHGRDGADPPASVGASSSSSRSPRPSDRSTRALWRTGILLVAGTVLPLGLAYWLAQRGRPHPRPRGRRRPYRGRAIQPPDHDQDGR